MCSQEHACPSRVNINPQRVKHGMLNSGLLEKIIERRKNHFLYEYTKLASKLTMTSGMSDVMRHKTDKGRLSRACINLQYTVMAFQSPSCLKSNGRDKRRAELSPRLTSSAVAANWAGPWPLTGQVRGETIFSV